MIPSQTNILRMLLLLQDNHFKKEGDDKVEQSNHKAELQFLNLLLEDINFSMMLDFQITHIRIQHLVLRQAGVEQVIFIPQLILQSIHNIAQITKQHAHKWTVWIIMPNKISAVDSLGSQDQKQQINMCTRREFRYTSSFYNSELVTT